MSPDVKEKMFNPFFTTKPTGEGTGLGLSISHDIIVKQHAGSIEVDTLPGEFTEIRIILPRTAVLPQGPLCRSRYCLRTCASALQCPLLALSGHRLSAPHMSAFGGKADIAFCAANVRF